MSDYTIIILHAVGDAGNEVLTTSELAKLKFDPNLYRVNAYQGLVYDPMRKSNHCRQTHAAILTYMLQALFLLMLTCVENFVQRRKGEDTLRSSRVVREECLILQ